MLADGLGGYVFGHSVALGVQFFLIVVAIETPIAILLWRLSWWKGIAWVFVANVCSSLAGFLPTLALKSARFGGQLLEADPWATHESYWQHYAVLVGTLFGITLVVEGLVCLGLDRVRSKRMSIKRLVVGLVGANVLSYSALIWVVWVFPPHSGGFEFHASCDWVGTDARRVWFVDRTTRHLCSIRLDGSDRRTELSAELSRLSWAGDVHSVYAVLPESNTVLYIGDGDRWYCVQDGQARALTARASYASPVRHDVWAGLHEALVELGVPVDDSEDALSPVFFAATAHPWGVRAESPGYEVDTSPLWIIGKGNWGIRVTSRGNGDSFEFGIKSGIATLPCRAPAITADEGFVLFRCGGWLMLMDPVRKQIGRLVEGDSMMLETDAFRKQYNW